jgi:hypothetical protein
MNTEIAEELKVTQFLNKVQDCRRNLDRQVNGIPLNRLPWVIKHFTPKGRSNKERPLKRLLDV